MNTQIYPCLVSSFVLSIILSAHPELVDGSLFYSHFNNMYYAQIPAVKNHYVNYATVLTHI